VGYISTSLVRWEREWDPWRVGAKLYPRQIAIESAAVASSVPQVQQSSPATFAATKIPGGAPYVVEALERSEI
jgi:hypothetical protein